MNNYPVSLTRFFNTDTGIDLAIDWFQVAAMQRHHLRIHIILKNGSVIEIHNISLEMVIHSFNILYDQWKSAISNYM